MSELSLLFFENNVSLSGKDRFWQLFKIKTKIQHNFLINPDEKVITISKINEHETKVFFVKCWDSERIINLYIYIMISGKLGNSVDRSMCADRKTSELAQQES